MVAEADWGVDIIRANTNMHALLIIIVPLLSASAVVEMAVALELDALRPAYMSASMASASRARRTCVFLRPSSSLSSMSTMNDIVRRGAPSAHLLHTPHEHYFYHSRSQLCIGGTGNAPRRKWKMTMSANDGAASQGATSQSSTYSYTRLDDDDNGDDHRDTNASYIGGRSRRDMQHILEVMEKAAYLAGEITRTTSGRIAVQMTKANERDLVTQSDLQCQRLIREVLSKEFPGDVFLGEEEEEDDEGDDTDATVATIPSSDVLKNTLHNLVQQEGGGNEGRLLFIVVRMQLFLLRINRRRKSHVYLFYVVLSFVIDCQTSSNSLRYLLSNFRILLMERRTFKLVRTA